LLQKIGDVLFGISSTRSHLAPADIDIADFAIMNQRGELVLGDVEPPGGFLRCQQWRHAITP
jgi:hypothetical protein